MEFAEESFAALRVALVAREVRDRQNANLSLPKPFPGERDNTLLLNYFNHVRFPSWAVSPPYHRCAFDIVQEHLDRHRRSFRAYALRFICSRHFGLLATY